MRIGGSLGALVATAIVAAATAFGASAEQPVNPVSAALVAERTAIAPGETVWVDLHLDIAKGWHTYWRNPGDSGLPTKIDWTLPPGIAAGEIVWPTPERFVQGTIGNYGYAGAVDLLVPITAAKTVGPGAAGHLAARASWLVCSDICIPGEAELALDLPVGAPGTAGPGAAQIVAARERLPQPAGFDAKFAASGREIRLFVPAAALAGLSRPRAAFFPLDDNIVDAAAEPKQQPRAEGLELVLARQDGPTARLPATLAGVLALRGADGSEHAYTIAATAAPAPPVEDGDAPWWQPLLLAFIGGLILNLMPCVFPVLSLKLLGLTASLHRAEERRHAAAYAAGVVVSFVALGGLLLLLRASGAAVGWGFQLQSPVVVALLAYLLFAMGLVLSEVAEIGVGIGGAGARFVDQGGIAGAFATGALATAVATPCTAPFMGTALGFALVAPLPIALGVFVALGMGLAAPMVLVAAAPGVARVLPRPGPWMVWFKQLLAFPLYGTVAWLIWVLLQEVAPGGGLLALLGLVAIGFAVWIHGRTRLATSAVCRAGAGLAAGSFALAVVLAAVLAGSGPPMRNLAAGGELGYQRFTSARLARLTAEHQPVFVNLTAAWCITCLVNERTTLESSAVRGAFAGRGVVALKGDWTRQDPEITAFLLKFGRSGVPLYLLYDKAGAPTILPQLLTEAGVLSALGKI